MSNKIVGKRQHIAKLRNRLRLPIDVFDSLLELYDMYRPINKPSPKAIDDAISYSFLEHILRVSTGADEEAACMDCIRFARLKSLMKDFITEKRDNSTQAAMMKLEKLELELKDINCNAFVKIHEVEGSEMMEVFEEPEGDGFWPFINVLRDGDKAYILYTYQATFLDGYLPHESKPTTHLIPDNIIDSQRPSVCRQVGVGLFADEDPDPLSPRLNRSYNNSPEVDPKVAELERQIQQIREAPKVIVSSPVDSFPSTPKKQKKIKTPVKKNKNPIPPLPINEPERPKREQPEIPKRKEKPKGPDKNLDSSRIQNAEYFKIPKETEEQEWKKYEDQLISRRKARESCILMDECRLF